MKIYKQSNSNLMKTTFLFIIGMIIGSWSYAQTTNLTIEVTNFKNTDGKLRVALFNSEGTYLKDSQYTSDTLVYSQELVKVSFTGLPNGEYAISIYHDQNDNGELDANFMGIPTEPYAFSNNAKGRFGPASYADSKFSLNQSNQIHSIQLN
ncbi:MAG: hypothetical protein CMP48_09870 [Rickettsiales bacterium]|nr:hypothetical protein [Rickettsiales bacterium]